MGRPSELNDKVIANASGYLDTCVDSYDERTKTWNVELPSIEGLAIFLDVNRSTIYDWRQVNKEFADILDKILAEQAKRLIGRGLGGQYNSNIAKLALGKHGYHDKAEVDHKNDGGKFETPLSPAVMEATRKYEEEIKKTLID